MPKRPKKFELISSPEAQLILDASVNSTIIVELYSGKILNKYYGHKTIFS